MVVVCECNHRALYHFQQQKSGYVCHTYNVLKKKKNNVCRSVAWPHPYYLTKIDKENLTLNIHADETIIAIHWQFQWYRIKYEWKDEGISIYFSIKQKKKKLCMVLMQPMHIWSFFQRKCHDSFGLYDSLFGSGGWKYKFLSIFPIRCSC